MALVDVVPGHLVSRARRPSRPRTHRGIRLSRGGGARVRHEEPLAQPPALAGAPRVGGQAEVREPARVAVHAQPVGPEPERQHHLLEELVQEVVRGDALGQDQARVGQQRGSRADGLRLRALRPRDERSRRARAVRGPLAVALRGGAGVKRARARMLDAPPDAVRQEESQRRANSERNHPKHRAASVPSSSQARAPGSAGGAGPLLGVQQRQNLRRTPRRHRDRGTCPARVGVRVPRISHRGCSTFLGRVDLSVTGSHTNRASAIFLGP